MHRAKARVRAAAPPQAEGDRGLHVGPTLPFAPVTNEQADRIVQAAFTLLAEIGVRFEAGTEADELLAAAGCAVGGEGVVRIPKNVALQALATAARHTRLWNRDATAALDIDDRHTWFLPGMTCIKFYDENTG